VVASSRSLRVWAVALGWLPAVVVLLAGCTRERYFRQADQEVNSLIAEKSSDPRWCAPPNFTVMMDPRSRYYDPCDLVRPPMPPDDPASHVFMHCVDGMKGWRRWHANGDRSELENPDWWQRMREYADVTDEGRVKLSLESSLRIAYINSPDYQDQLETLYLSALDVSTERFRFDVQFFGGTQTNFTHTGRLNPGGERNTLEHDTSFQLERRFATAGELLVGFANSMVWQFAGPDTNATASILNFNLVQPLLRAGGRAVALEQLTIAERTLLANLRALQRYRQGFFTRVAIGESGVSGPQRRGGFFGGTGLTGFTGTGSSGFGGVGDVTGFGGRIGGGGAAGGGGGSAGLVGGGAGTVGGVIGLLQQLQQIRNSEDSLGAQLRMLGLLEAHLQAGTIDLTQVDQFRQNIETERATLLQARNSLENGLDSYNTGTLGLPPHVPVELDDGLIRQFRLIDPSMLRFQDGIGAFRAEFGEEPQEPEVDVLRRAIDRLETLRSEAGAQFELVSVDVAGVEKAGPNRALAMSPVEQKSFASELKKLSESPKNLRERLEQTGPRLAQLRDRLAPATRRDTADKLVQVVTEIASIVDELSLVQARARLEQVTVEHETLDANAALDIARANRLDWMNNRAALVNSWRLITFNANALESNLTVSLSGEMNTVGNNPLKFRAPTGTVRAGLQFDAPFTRLLERNNFRQVLINYQGDRRQLIQFEDSVEQTLRGLLRQLDLLRVNLEIQRRAVVIAIRRVDRTRDVLNQPPPAPQPGQPVTPLGPTAAMDLLTALNDVRSAQNNFMSVWLVYEATRMRLARELGVMELDERGMWIDRSLGEVARTRAEDAPLPPAVPEVWLDELDKAPPPQSSGEKKIPPAKADSPSPQPSPGRKAPLPATASDQAALLDKRR